MGSIIDKITEFIKEMLQGWVLDNLETMFTDVDTKVGTIAGMIIENESPETPIQKKLGSVGKILGIACLVICGIIFIIGLIFLPMII